MLQRLKEWLFGSKKVRPASTALERLSAEELRHITKESDYISATVDATEGLLAPEDMERLKALTHYLDEINKRSKSD